MDNTIRKNEKCIIGLPRCDYVFSSTRSCFIGYGFNESTLEMNILKEILNHNDIAVVEAGGGMVPGQNAFCVKICSKIITAQFCIILLNNEMKNQEEIPNANVNMEYGLMLGFNKYIIPFQRENQKLPFNVAGLDTIKYTNQNFSEKAKKAIVQAIEQTTQKTQQEIGIDQILDTFILAQKTQLTNIENLGERLIFDLGKPYGFYLLNDFSGFSYIYLGNFTNLRPETVIWRISLINELYEERLKTLPDRIRLGMAIKESVPLLEEFISKMKVWIVINSKEDKEKIETELIKKTLLFSIELFTTDDIKSIVEKYST